ncbi:hypothetical protein [Thermococcus sp.]|uniref:hypothetical protein n=1 Tax=Thermococcus sp. TaxID=35749 RepID=UPI00261F63EB|nr:hypothetical protein [Thermococcus sp.]
MDIADLVLLFAFGSMFGVWYLLEDMWGSDPLECSSKGCAKNGMKGGLILSVLSVLGSFLLQLGALMKSPGAEVYAFWPLWLLIIMFAGTFIYGLYTWHKYKERYKGAPLPRGRR